jgi:hypothetical protein
MFYFIKFILARFTKRAKQKPEDFKSKLVLLYTEPLTKLLFALKNQSSADIEDLVKNEPVRFVMQAQQLYKEWQQLQSSSTQSELSNLSSNTENKP